MSNVNLFLRSGFVQQGAAPDRYSAALHSGRRAWSFASTLENIMPEISRFFGIIIRMFYDEHNPPHFHAD
ncbi:DUF4160 domain-containing protein [Thermodesulfovibrionales bacterium]|nr:DUF4160 domain-containing protein [Thermodesulfovibrionales bacterium]